jgi:hypothetical protein
MRPYKISNNTSHDVPQPPTKIANAKFIVVMDAAANKYRRALRGCSVRIKPVVALKTSTTLEVKMLPLSAKETYQKYNLLDAA